MICDEILYEYHDNYYYKVKIYYINILEINFKVFNIQYNIEATCFKVYKKFLKKLTESEYNQITKNY